MSLAEFTRSQRSPINIEVVIAQSFADLPTLALILCDLQSSPPAKDRSDGQEPSVWLPRFSR